MSIIHDRGLDIARRLLWVISDRAQVLSVAVAVYSPGAKTVRLNVLQCTSDRVRDLVPGLAIKRSGYGDWTATTQYDGWRIEIAGADELPADTTPGDERAARAFLQAHIGGGGE